MRFIDNEIRDKDITGIQLAILNYISNSTEEVYQKDIEKNFTIQRSSASSALKLMEKNGFILKEEVAHDARLKKIVLTDKAIAIQKKMKGVRADLDKKMGNGISEEELEVLFRVIDKITINIS